MTSTTKCGSIDLVGKRAARIRSLDRDLANTESHGADEGTKGTGRHYKNQRAFTHSILPHRKPHVRWEAAKALCGIADPLAAAALVNAFDDRDGDVRWLAAEGVAALGREAATFVGGTAPAG